MRAAFWKYRLTIICGIVLVAPVPDIATAATAFGAITKVTEIHTATDYGGGDAVVKLAWHHPNCSDGYWMSQSQPGFESTLSALLMALAAGTDVIVNGRDHDLWPGSGGSYCKIDLIKQLAP